MQTAIVYESEDHFSASFEDSPFESFGGHTPTEALKRLCETLPGFDVDSRCRPRTHARRLHGVQTPAEFVVRHSQCDWGIVENRIVRVGTHTGNNQLPSRIKQHFLNENKDRSIFRKNIGRCLLNRADDPFLEFWNLDLTSRAAREEHQHKVDFVRQKEIERQVTEYLQSRFWFVAFEVPEKAARLKLESKIISTVSLCDECRPSPGWLGLSSPKERIRDSGLWLVNELWKTPLSAADFGILSELVGVS